MSSSGLYNTSTLYAVHGYS